MCVVVFQQSADGMASLSSAFLFCQVSKEDFSLHAKPRYKLSSSVTDDVVEVPQSLVKQTPLNINSYVAIAF